MRINLACAALLVAAGGTGCMGVYAEATATVYPSLKYSASDSNTTPTPGAPTVSPFEGGGYAVGFSLGFDFDGKRKTRVAIGYTGHSTSLPNGGSATGGMSELRFDIKLARVSKDARIRLGMGFGFGDGKTTLKLTDGSETTDKKGNGQVFAGPVFAQYFGKRHELSVMGAGSYVLLGAPGGSISGAGVGARVTYSFHFGDTRPSYSEITPMDSSQNLLKLVDAGAKRAGCESRYVEHRGATDAGGYGLTVTGVFAKCPPDKEEIRFFQTAGAVMVECPHQEEEECREMVSRIIDATKAILKEGKKPPPPAAAPPPVTTPPVTTPPVTTPPPPPADDPARPMQQ